MEPVVERIQKLIVESGFTAKHIFTKLEISTNALSEWKKGKAKPSIDAIIKIATFFNVSADYLLFGHIKASELRNDEKELLNLYNQLPDNIQHECIGIMKGYTLANRTNMESELQRRKA